jgi:hypothetical protein
MGDSIRAIPFSVAQLDLIFLNPRQKHNGTCGRCTCVVASNQQNPIHRKGAKDAKEEEGEKEEERRRNEEVLFPFTMSFFAACVHTVKLC